MADLILVYIIGSAFIGAFIHARYEDDQTIFASLLQATIWPLGIGAMAAKFLNQPLPNRSDATKEDH